MAALCACGGSATEPDAGAADACEPLTCHAAGPRCGALDDGCGGSLSCGCSDGMTCEDGVCACVPEDEAALCSRLGKSCGEAQGLDPCGVERTAWCGMCQPVALASNQAFPRGIALDSTHVYWANVGGTIMKAPVGGGDATQLAEELACWSVQVDATYVYWPTVTLENAFELRRAPLAGGDPETLAASSDGSFYALAIDGAHAYWGTETAPAKVSRVPLAGGAATEVAEGDLEPNVVATDGAYVYWSDDFAIRRAPKAGGAATLVAGGQHGVSGMTLDATYVYWTNYSPGDGTVRKKPLAGGDEVIVASGQLRPLGIAVDASGIYWVNQGEGEGDADGTIMKVRHSGGDPIVLATDQASPWFIALDETSVYWTNGADDSEPSAPRGTVMRLAK